MNALQDKVRSFAAAHGLLQEQRILVGISGGADSLILATILQKLGHTIKASHINFKLRNEAADADEAFVRSWCGERSIPLSVHSFETADVAKSRGQSIQETARDLRYSSFAEEANASGIGIVAVGHHRDDQAETVLLHLFRGSGPEGLAGIPSRRPLGPDVHLERPLLCVTREEIEAYARERGLEWREDATNIKPIYRRGALRAEIIPLIEKHFGGAVRENIARSSDLLRAYVERSMSDDIAQAFESASLGPAKWGQLREGAESEARALNVEQLRQLSPVVRGRVILEAVRRWIPGTEATSIAVREIENLLDSQPGRRVVYREAEVWRDRHLLMFKPRGGGGEAPVMPLEIGKAAALPQGVVRAELMEHPPENLDAGTQDVAYVDADRLKPPLTVRPWRAGDRFLPLGMTSTKKVSDFLTDEHVPPQEKSRVLVVESNSTIAWVVGRRISNDFRVERETNRVIRLSFSPRENSSIATE